MINHAEVGLLCVHVTECSFHFGFACLNFYLIKFMTRMLFGCRIVQVCVTILPRLPLGWEGAKDCLQFWLHFPLYFRFRANSPGWTLGEFAHCPSVDREIY